MQIGEITDFLTFNGLQDAILLRRGTFAMGVSTPDKAKKGDVAWSKGPCDFHGSLLLNSKHAMALVIKEFFPDKKPVLIHPTAQIGSGTVIGEDGFGYVWTGKDYMRWPHVGGVRIEDDVEIGNNSAVDRGSIVDTIIRRGVKVDNLVHIAHNADIGAHSLIVAGAVICGSATVGERCYVGANATVLQKIKIGDGAVIGAGSVVTKDVPPGECWMGNPARFYKEASDVPRP